MEVEIPFVRTILINAIVEQVHTFDSGASHLRILQETGQMDAWSWLPSMGQDTERVLKAEVCAMPASPARPPEMTAAMTTVLKMLMPA